MKKKLALLMTIIFILGLTVSGMTKSNKVYAKTAQLYLEVPESIKKENEFTVKVILDSDVQLYSIDAFLSYDSDLLEFIPLDERITGAEGVLELKDVYEEETKSAVYEITFRALDTGMAEVGLTDVYLIDYADLDYITITPSIKHFEIGINKKVSADARLAELLVAPGELTEAFNADCLDYEMHVGLDVETIGVSAIPMEEDSVVSLEMPEKLKPGKNIVVITVTALSGNINVYTVTVIKEERKEGSVEFEEDTEEQPESDKPSLDSGITENTTEYDEESNTTEEISTEATSESTAEISMEDSSEELSQ